MFKCPCTPWCDFNHCLLSEQVGAGDEVLDYLSLDDSKYAASVDPLEQRVAYARVAKKRSLDLPLFYLSVLPSNYPDSLFLILPVSDRQTVKNGLRHPTKGRNHRLVSRLAERLRLCLPFGGCITGSGSIMSDDQRAPAYT